MKKRLSLILVTAVFFLTIIIAPLLLIALPKKDFSENENRVLASAPEFSFKSLTDGSFTKELEEYFIDHFPGRDAFVSLKTFIETALGRREINGVFICKNGFYMDKYEKPKDPDRIVKAVNELKKATNAEIQLMLAPTAVTVYSDYLPKSADCYDQTKVIDSIYKSVTSRCIDITGTLIKHKNDNQLYYKLDHHWTTFGAYYAYCEYCSVNNLKPLSEDKFTVKAVTDCFKGTTYSKVNDLFAKGDDIYIFDNPSLEVEVTYPDKQIKSDSMYEKSYLMKKDKYSYFLNNLNTYVEIENKNISSTEELVVVKDSYANCLVPFLANHYKRIYVIDPRSCNDTISDYINERPNVKKVLVLYNVGTLDTDVGVGKIY